MARRWKALIEEEFGDGIMSAIDFDLQMERLPDPKGDRVKITMSGKFLPYKYYGAGRQPAAVWLQGGVSAASEFVVIADPAAVARNGDGHLAPATMASFGRSGAPATT